MNKKSQKQKSEIDLDQLINYYISANITQSLVPSNDGTENISSEELDYVCHAARADIRRQIKQQLIDELTSEEKHRIIVAAKKQFNKEQVEQKTRNLGIMLLEGGLLAIIVGMLVNQLTNWIEFGIEGLNKLGWTIGLSVFFLLLIIIAYLILLLHGIIPLFKSEDNDE